MNETGNILIEGATAFVLPYEGYLLLIYDDVANKWRVVSENASYIMGPASATDGHLLVADGTSGKKAKDGGAPYSHPNHTGNVTSAGDGATTIAAGAVTLAMLANLAAESIIANNTGNAATPAALAVAEQRVVGRITGGHIVDLTAAQVKTLLAIVAGDLPATLTPAINQYSTALAADHAYWGDVIYENVGENVNFGQLLYFDCSEVEWKLAKADAEGTMPCMGISVSTSQVTDGNPCLILLRGGVRHDAWTWAVTDAANTKTLYVSGATAGLPTVTPVSTSGYFSQAVAIVKTATTIQFRPSLSMAKVA